MRIALKGKPRKFKAERKRSEDKELPINVESYIDNKTKKMTGYRGTYRKDGPVRKKAFTSSAYTMEEKLEMAKKFAETRHILEAMVAEADAEIEAGEVFPLEFPKPK